MSHDPITAFGQVVREARLAQGMSQQDLAFEAELDRSFVSLLETAKKQPSLLTIFQLSAALGLTPSGLLSRVEQVVKLGYKPDEE